VTRDRKLEAPHRRLEPRSRFFERGVVLGYKAVAWVTAHIPQAIPRFVIARSAQASYLLWPSKRTFSNLNYGHVLGLPPGHRKVRMAVLGAYGEYARYIVENMRLQFQAQKTTVELVDTDDIDEAEAIWRESKGGLILVLGHIGNPEMVGAAIAARKWPVSVVADDSAFPEMFEIFRQTRERLGVTVIPWRNLREIYGVLKRREMLALLIDWGYRADGVPVRLFDAWTTLPAGPATLAAKSGARILPVAIRRGTDGRFHTELAEPFEVASSSPADIQAATQRLADALQAAIGAAPSQWYSFKPMWPADPAEAADLERRAATMHAGVAATPATPTPVAAPA
jgi:lauroyl/myristoyl acyltransferase